MGKSLLLTGVVIVPMALGFWLLFATMVKGRPRTVRRMTGWVKSAYCETLASPTPYVAQINWAEDGPGFAYYVQEKRLFEELQELVGQPVTVEIGEYSAFSGRWVVRVVEAGAADGRCGDG